LSERGLRRALPRLRLAVFIIALVSVSLLGAFAQARAHAQPAPAPGAVSTENPFGPLEIDSAELIDELTAAAIRLPIAALLGTALALRPRRRGTPARQPAVVQTQIVLAVVGALIMLVVGASLARAFGIVGAANLIRYRSKIEDPKDAVVMLCALSVGLASGVGLFGLAVFGTLFLVFALWIIESFEPQTRTFELSVKLGASTAELRPQVEAILRRFQADFELRGQSGEEVSYIVIAPLELHTDRVSNALTSLIPNDAGAVEWKERPKAKSKA
jgi:hypothetical protein